MEVEGGNVTVEVGDPEIGIAMGPACGEAKAVSKKSDERPPAVAAPAGGADIPNIGVGAPLAGRRRRIIASRRSGRPHVVAALVGGGGTRLAGRGSGGRGERCWDPGEHRRPGDEDADEGVCTQSPTSEAACS